MMMRAPRILIHYYFGSCFAQDRADTCQSVFRDIMESDLCNGPQPVHVTIHMLREISRAPSRSRFSWAHERGIISNRSSSLFSCAQCKGRVDMCG